MVVVKFTLIALRFGDYKRAREFQVSTQSKFINSFFNRKHIKN